MALHVTDIVSIGAVDKGDNPESWITMFKRKKANAVSVEQTQRDDMTFDVSALPDEAQEHIAKLVADGEALTAAIAAQEAKIVELTPVEDPAETEIEKASDEVQALIAKQREQLDEQAESLKVEVAKRRDTEFIAKIQKDNLVELLGKAEEVGPVLRELSDAAPEAFDKIYPAFVAAAQRTEPFLKEFDLLLCIPRIATLFPEGLAGLSGQSGGTTGGSSARTDTNGQVQGEA